MCTVHTNAGHHTYRIHAKRTVSQGSMIDSLTGGVQDVHETLPAPPPLTQMRLQLRFPLSRPRAPW